MCTIHSQAHNAACNTERTRHVPRPCWLVGHAMCLPATWDGYLACQLGALWMPACLQTPLPLLPAPQAPINPSDINTVQGKYPLRPALPGVPGHEGVAEVLRAGRKVGGVGRARRSQCTRTLHTLRRAALGTAPHAH